MTDDRNESGSKSPAGMVENTSEQVVPGREGVAEGTSPARGRWLGRILALVIGIVLGDQLLFWSGAMRPIQTLMPLIQVDGDDAPPHYWLRSDLDAEWRSWGNANVTRIHTNSLGYRVPTSEGSGPRVIATGDSVTFGIAVEDDEAMPPLLERLLNADGPDINVWNAGVPGWSMTDHLAALDPWILAHDPDVVVLQLTRNDSAVPMPFGSAIRSAVRFSGFAQAWMLYRFNFHRDPELFATAFSSYVRRCVESAVSLVVWYGGLPDGSDDLVRAVTREAGVELISVHCEKLSDDPHFSPAGNQCAAEQVLPAVRRALVQSAQR